MECQFVCMGCLSVNTFVRKQQFSFGYCYVVENMLELNKIYLLILSFNAEITNKFYTFVLRCISVIITETSVCVKLCNEK